MTGYFKYDSRDSRVQLRDLRDLRDPDQKPPKACRGAPALKIQQRICARVDAS
jgi:hypothetical protein